jgi:hypothetical protein
MDHNLRLLWFSSIWSGGIVKKTTIQRHKPFPDLETGQRERKTEDRRGTRHNDLNQILYPLSSFQIPEDSRYPLPNSELSRTTLPLLDLCTNLAYILSSSYLFYFLV